MERAERRRAQLRWRERREWRERERHGERAKGAEGKDASMEWATWLLGQHDPLKQFTHPDLPSPFSFPRALLLPLSHPPPSSLVTQSSSPPSHSPNLRSRPLRRRRRRPASSYEFHQASSFEIRYKSAQILRVPFQNPIQGSSRGGIIPQNMLQVCYWGMCTDSFHQDAYKEYDYWINKMGDD
ncbi:hypothetical protein Droror1_Dr00024365 [Drosera rotundifolia]